ncbi:MAG: HupE/UreJ family protein [Cyanobacteriota bacterium]
MAFHSSSRSGPPLISSPASGALAPVALLGVALTLVGLLNPAPAAAHHLMGLFQLSPGPLAGWLSGLGHPLLGPDHLLFLLAVGLVAWSRPWGWALALLSAGLVGNALGLLLPQLPGVELLVALSLVATGLVLARRLPAPVLIPLYVFHGLALSGAVIGWEATPIACYLLGLLVSQSLLLLLAFTVVRRWRSLASEPSITLISGLFIGLGLAFSWTSLMP